MSVSRYCMVFCFVAGMMSPVSATTIQNITTGQWLFYDNFENVSAINAGYADDPGTTDYDPVAITGTWEVSETDSAVDAPREIQVTNFSGTTTTSVTYPGAFEGDNYLWLHRTSDLNKTNGYLTSIQSTPGEMIHIEFMAYIRNWSSGGGPGVFSLYKLPDGTGDRIVGLAANSNGTVSDGSGVKWTANQWQKWEIDYEIGASQYTLTIDGTSGTSNALNGAGNAGSFRHSTSQNVEYYVDAVPVPEPSTFVLLVASLIGLVAWRKRK